MPCLRAKGGSDHQHYLVVSEFSHRWSTEYVHSMQIQDTFLAMLQRVDDPQLQQAMDALAKQHGMTKLPDVYYKNPPVTDVSSTSREGNLYILLDPHASVKDQIATLSHEFGHLAHHDYDPAKVAALHNAQNYLGQRQTERDADRAAVDACQGRPARRCDGSEIDGIARFAGIEKYRRRCGLPITPCA